MNVGCCKHNWSSTEQIHVPCTSSLASDVPVDELYLCIRGQLCAWAWKHIVLLPCMCIRVEVGTVDEHGYNSQQKHIICDTCTTQFKLNDASFSSNLTDLLCLQVYQVPTCRSHDLVILLWKMITTRQNRLHVLTPCTCLRVICIQEVPSLHCHPRHTHLAGYNVCIKSCQLSRLELVTTD